MIGGDDRLCDVSTLCEYDKRNCDLVVLSWGSLVSDVDVSDVLIESVIALLD